MSHSPRFKPNLDNKIDENVLIEIQMISEQPKYQEVIKLIKFITLNVEGYHQLTILRNLIAQSTIFELKIRSEAH